MEEFSDPNLCLNIAEFDASKIHLPGPLKSPPDHMERYIPRYGSGYLQIELDDVIFYEGINVPDDFGNPSIRYAPFSFIKMDVKTEEFIKKIECFVGDNFGNYQRIIIRSGNAHVNAEYFSTTDIDGGKTQLIDGANNPIELEVLTGRKFRGYPVLRFEFDFSGKDDTIIRVFLISVKVTDIMVQVTPEVHQKTVSAQQQANLEKKLVRIRSLLNPVKTIPIESISLPKKDDRDEKMEKATMDSLVREKLKTIRAKQSNN